MKRIALLLAAVLYWAIILLPQAVAAPPPGKIVRIGYLVVSPLSDTPSPERAGFLKGLRELGYEEGKNLIIEYRSADGTHDMLPFLTEELVSLNVDAIVGMGSPVIRAAKEATSSIPIVMLFAADPVALGFVESLARPGANITGMTHMPADVAAKRLQLLKETLPSVAHVAVVWDGSNPGAVPERKAIEAGAKRLGIRVSLVDISQPQDPFERITAIRPDAIVTIIDPRVAVYRESLPKFALKHKLPTMFDWKGFIDVGGLVSYAPDFPELSRRAAVFVDKIVNGANPATLPVEQPTTFELIINLKTAKSLGVRIPDHVLLRADKVIE
jgi:putative tryptophan/tyrosine transport system substrate-binding protein